MTISQPNTKSRVTLSFTFAAPPPVEEWSQDQTSDLGLYRLRLLAERISLQEGFDELLCLDTLTGVETFWYQIETVKPPPRWPTREARTQQIGDAWIQNRRSLALAVPSVIVQEEFNYLLNPTHPDFPKLNLSKLLPFTLDLRLLA